MNCHGGDLAGGPAGPALIGTEYDADEIGVIAREGTENGGMPPGMFEGTDEELDQFVEFIGKVNEENEE